MTLGQRFDIWTQETLEILASDAELETGEEVNRYYNPDLQEQDIMERF